MLQAEHFNNARQYDIVRHGPGHVTGAYGPACALFFTVKLASTSIKAAGA